jgi:hypothetical protein
VHLRALLVEAGWAGQDLARAVNAAGTENGLSLRYDRTSIGHWLSGSCPPEHICEMVAESLSRHLLRRVTVNETALGHRHTDDSPDPPVPGRAEDMVARLAQLAGTGPGRRDVVRTLAYTAVAAVPAFASLLTSSQIQPRTPGEAAGSRAEPAQWQMAGLVLSAFADSDAMFGGGRARPALRAYLATDVAQWLRAPASSRDRHELLCSAGRLTYLAGYMCFDDNLNGAAQAYYRTAAHLFTEAGDSAGFATALRAMSIQAYFLGHHEHAWDLAESAVRHRSAVPSGQSAQLSAQLAVAAAGHGDRRAAFAHLSQAQALLSRGHSSHGTIGTYHLSSLAHQEAEILALTGDRPGAIAALTTSLRHRPSGERRARALTTARLAELHLEQGELEQACTGWDSFLDDLPHLQSARATAALGTLRSRLMLHQRVPAAREVLARVALLARPA